MKKGDIKEGNGVVFRPKKSHMLGIVNRHFPQVKKILEAKEPLVIEVTKKDITGSKRKDHENCAMAQACKRAYEADGVIVARQVAYLVKNDIAVKFNIPQTVSREITSFDRGGTFEPGIYQLSVPNKSQTAEYRREHNNARKRDLSKEGKSGKKKPLKHLTLGIRAILGSADDKG